MIENQTSNTNSSGSQTRKPYGCDQNTARQVEIGDNLAVNGQTRQPYVCDQNTARQVEIGDNLTANGQTR